MEKNIMEKISWIYYNMQKKVNILSLYHHTQVTHWQFSKICTTKHPPLLSDKISLQE